MKRIILMLTAALIVAGATAQSSIYDIKVKDADYKEVSLKQYEGKVLLIVNTATKCGFTPQYKELEALYEKYGDRGLVILDFPCNQFGNQEPGTYREIHQFCTANFDIQFPQFQKIDVNGPEESPLYTLLKQKQGFKGFGNGPKAQGMHRMLLGQDKDYATKSSIKWNFTKFLVNRKGNVVQRFEPTESISEIEKAVEKLL